ELGATLFLFGLLGDVFDPFLNLALGLAEGLARRTGRPLDLAFGLELGVVENLARLVLHVALGLLGLALDLVAVHRPSSCARSRARRCSVSATALPAWAS